MDRLIEYVGHHPLLVATAVVAALIVFAYEYYLRMQGYQCDFAAGADPAS